VTSPTQPGVAAETTDDQTRDSWVLGDIISSLESRMNRFQTGEFRWEETHWFRKGSLGAEGEMVPPNDQLSRISRRLVFDRKKVRTETDGQFWDDRIKTFNREIRTGVWLPKNERPFEQVTQFDGDIPYGSLHNHNWCIRHEATFRVFFYAFRVLDEDWGGLDLDAFNVKERSVDGNGHDRIVLEHLRPMKSIPGKALQNRVWLSPTQGMAITRHQVGRTGAMPMEELDIDYESRDGLWVPSGWKYIINSGGNPAQVIQADVTHVSLNQPVDSAEFNLSLPEGAWIQDFVTNKNGKGFREFLVVGDREREILPSELDVPYERLLETETGMAHSSSSSGRILTRRILLVLSLMIVCGAAVWIAYRQMWRKDAR